MKILLATSCAIPSGGGIASYNQELLQILGVNNELYLMSDSDEPEVPGYKGTMNTFNEPVFNYKYSKNKIDIINSQKFDLIINSDHSAIPVWVPFLNAPVVSVAHFVNGVLADNAGYNNKYISAIIVLSNYCKDYLMKKFPSIDQNKIKVVYNFVSKNTKEYNPEKEEREPLAIVFPGGTSVHKSFDVVLELALKLMKTDLAFRFVWLGTTKLSGANYSVAGLKEIPQIIRGDERFIVTGRVPRIVAEQHMADTNIFLLPSKGEGCPITLLEAMRNGCIPVISDAKHGSLELVQKCGCGVITKQGDSSSLFRAITGIIKNHENYRHCYKQTYDFAMDYLSQDRWKKEMNEIFLGLRNVSKHEKRLNRINFYTSLVPFRIINFQDRIKVLIHNTVIRIKVDALFIKWRKRSI